MVFYNNPGGSGKENPEVLGNRVKAYLEKPLAELELSVRSASALQAAGINTVRDLVAHTELDLLKYRNFGRKSLNELNRILSDMGLRLGMKLGQ